MPVSNCFAVTVAPVTAAPDGSVTVPETVAETWAKVLELHNSRKARKPKRIGYSPQ
jgi:hypothetical protein